MAYGESSVITYANLVNWVPVVWSQKVLADIEHSLVTGALCDRSYEGMVASGGRKLVVPTLDEIAAQVVNTAVDQVFYNVMQNTVNIALDKEHDIGIEVDDINQLQTNPKYFDAVRSKMAYGLAKVIDVNCAAQFTQFDSAVGTISTALSEDNLIDAYEYLNLYDAPFEDRAWVFDPESITDLMKLDYFVSMDYVPDSVSKQGFRGRQIFGSPVYITTNLTKYAAGSTEHISGYFQREGIALVMQMQPKFEVFRVPKRHADAISGLCVFGTQKMRNYFGVTINCRS